MPGAPDERERERTALYVLHNIKVGIFENPQTMTKFVSKPVNNDSIRTCSTNGTYHTPLFKKDS